jgi:hypothetical protein
LAERGDFLLLVGLSFEPGNAKVNRMMMERDKIFDVSSMGKLFRKSLEMFAYRLEDENGNEIRLDALEIEQKFFVVFPSDTGFTRTSGIRIA